MPNRLANAASPYLRQHADNPVDWYPWCEEALARARAEDKPILLSIGYSACHWCHVMAHESFEDPEVAALMNRHYVNIKVDREERPDLDQIYQTAHAMLTGRSGGWPLTVFLMPDDHTPFFAGTYFPKTTRYNLPGFKDILTRVAEVYHAQKEAIRQQNAALLEALSRTLPARTASRPAMDRALIRRAIGELAAIFDEIHGGFGTAPKFPHPAELELCLSRHGTGEAETGVEMARLTLTRMAEGGIYDQLGGGFCRYSVDQFWTIPHFEKMLYDNGPLLALYADAWLATRESLYEQVVAETAAWVMREMQSPEGGYYATLDADAEHEEGKFYVWDREEVAALLTEQEYAVVAPHYGFDRPPNFEGKHWHPRVAKSLKLVAEQTGLPLARCRELLASARRKLFEHRERRVHPGRDEKILTSWNGLMIRGMARAGRVFRRCEWIASARAAADFLREHQWRDGRLLAAHKDGTSYLNAYLDDYAFLLDGLLELLQAEFRPEDLAFARELAEALLAHFEDPEHGGFFFVSNDHEPLILRPKPGPDQATPSGNGIAALALTRLGHLLGENRYLEAAERTLALFYPAMERQPSAFSSLLRAMEEHIAPPTVVILRGEAAERIRWQAVLDEVYAPHRLVLSIGDYPDLPPTLRRPVTAKVNAWVCEGVQCLPAITDVEELRRVCNPRKIV
ncbi:thioredoxin domain-containing protein [Pelomicrobium methylotrophicum]|uniref:Thioredoxin domain-containing protein n=1 Tax=Pelomicrobium methylotrophicum TaxID=2602750 RepID=A0A5C7EJ67_9PROT|nr:thioredoxin domain-containing protein [Pelomicrobium methylotrophicum]TXF10986.1 thioredoxin domain-containing protein [Pelomicrobium methylotrophicum]